LSFTPVNDLDVEGDETVTISGSTTVADLRLHDATLTIEDDDDTPIIASVSVVTVAGGSTITEGDMARFEISVSPVQSSPLMVRLDVADAPGEHCDFLDSVDEGVRTVMIPSGMSSMIWEVATVADDIDEPDDYVTATVQAGVGYEVNGSRVGRVLVSDGEPVIPEVVIPGAAFVSGGARVEENVGVHAVQVRLDTAPSSPVTVPYTVGGTATAGTDYDALPGTITFAAGETSKSIPVTVHDDLLNEPDETVVLTLATGAGHELGGMRVHTLTIVDNDVPVVTVTPGESPVAEGMEVSFTVAADPAPWQALPVHLELSESGEYLAADIQMKPTVQIPAGASTAVLRLGTLEDMRPEEDGSVTAAILSDDAGDYVVGEPAQATVRVVDDDRARLEVLEDWLVRFGRTVTGVVLDAVEDRVSQMGQSVAPPGFTGELAGVPLAGGGVGESGQQREPLTEPAVTVETAESQAPTLDDAPVSVSAIGLLPDQLVPDAGDGQEEFGLSEAVWSGEAEELNAFLWDGTLPGSADMDLGSEELMAGTSFSLTGKESDGRRYGFWGRGSQAGFEGVLGDGRSVDGEVRSLILGHDIARAADSAGQRNWLAGGLVAISRGEGGYEVPDENPGLLEADMVSVVPYGAWDQSDELRLWGSAGLGQGSVRFLAGELAGQESDMEWRMAALGFRHDFGTTESGVGLSLHGDYRRTWIKTTGEILPLSGGTDRLRLRLEGTTEWQSEHIGRMEPTVSLGLRRDGGDVERGLGLDLGVGLSWAMPGGVVAELSGRTLALHEDGNFEDWGVSASIEWDPDADTARGFSGALGFDFGSESSGGVESLFGGEEFPELVQSEAEGIRWKAEGRYGLYRHGNGLLGSPYLALGGEEQLDEVRFGYRAARDREQGLDLEWDVFVRTLRGDGSGSGESSIGFELRLQW